MVLGLLTHLIFRREELDKVDAQMAMPEPEVTRPLWQNALYFAAMVWVLVFANWGRPEATTRLWHAIWSGKWALTALGAAGLGAILASWFGLKLWKLALSDRVAKDGSIRLPRRGHGHRLRPDL